MFTCGGRVNANITQSATSSGGHRLEPFVDGLGRLHVAAEANDGELGLDEARIHGRDADRPAEQVLAERVRVAPHRELRGDVRGAVRVGLPPGDRPHVDDVPAVPDVGQAEAGDPHQPGDVGRDHGRLVLLRRLVDRDAAERQAGVVEEDVDPSQLVHGRGDEALAALRHR